MLRCPNCNSHDLGKVGTNQFYCWQCFVEMTTDDKGISSIYQVEEDGSLTSLNDLFFEEDSRTVYLD
ncbi:hypothetical protein C1X05_12550 [Laceyella sacchari]|uniref:Uncharacterized protein n=1 Tax=Laceyella tengchongensis TaxID=574699 RepID=A0AA45WMC3_9BACL|nr:hypothetical protein [Laceyella tengchongensis]AUS09568.1 hypothetical protein C1X05_12550 [Laceyella sacchari]SMP13671.1 hypothetical protein SAMN06265361_102485 [Laceyella tengchongensis]